LTCGLALEGSNAPSCECLTNIYGTGTYYDPNCTTDPCELLPCQAPCQNCLDLTYCLSCITPDFREPIPSCQCSTGFTENDANECVKICPPGEFGIGDTCYPCNAPCFNCTVTADMCVDCVPFFKFYGNYTC